MKCFLCKSLPGNPNSLVKHLKVIQGLCARSTLFLKCGKEGCSRSFGSFSGFRKHLNKCHGSSSFDSLPQNTLNTSNDTNVGVATEHLDTEPKVSPRHIVNSCASAISDLKAASVAESTVNSFVISMEEIVQDIHQNAKKLWLRRCLIITEKMKFAKKLKHV